MKQLIKPFYLFAFVLISFCMFAQTPAVQMKEGNVFATPQAAADKAKNDLIQILETTRDINLGIDLSRLRESTQAPLIKHVMIDFEKLLRLDTITKLSDIAASDKGKVVPFVYRSEVTAIAEISQTEKGWRVSGLGNKAIADELSASGLLLKKEATITLYEVPNLHIMIYGVIEDQVERYHLNFERFSIREGVGIDDFYSLLRENAHKFHNEFGDILKQRRLVR
jgi:hypothetical protein